jgi:hypothetical protein
VAGAYGRRRQRLRWRWRGCERKKSERVENLIGREKERRERESEVAYRIG